MHDLSISGTGVTDAALKNFTALKKLYILSFAFTSVSNEGVQKLQVSLPNTRIIPANPYAAIE